MGSEYRRSVIILNRRAQRQSWFCGGAQWARKGRERLGSRRLPGRWGRHMCAARGFAQQFVIAAAMPSNSRRIATELVTQAPIVGQSPALPDFSTISRVPHLRTRSSECPRTQHAWANVAVFHWRLSMDHYTGSINGTGRGADIRAGGHGGAGALLGRRECLRAMSPASSCSAAGGSRFADGTWTVPLHSSRVNDSFGLTWEAECNVI